MLAKRRESQENQKLNNKVIHTSSSEFSSFKFYFGLVIARYEKHPIEFVLTFPFCCQSYKAWEKNAGHPIWLMISKGEHTVVVVVVGWRERKEGKERREKRKRRRRVEGALKKSCLNGGRRTAGVALGACCFTFLPTLRDVAIKQFFLRSYRLLGI